MTVNYEYDRTYNGPALPVVDLEVYRAGNRHNGITISHALLDSGADATMIPLRVLQQVKAQKVDWTRVRGVHGPSYVVEIYEVDLKLGVDLVPSLFVVADKFNSDAVIGRDLLNHFIVTLNGLAGVVEISQ